MGAERGDSDLPWRRIDLKLAAVLGWRLERGRLVTGLCSEEAGGGGDVL